MAEAAITMEIVTAERLVLRQQVDSLVLPGAGGYLGILPGHAALVSALDVGILRYRSGGASHKVAISGGFLEVAGNRAVVLADTAERGEEVDVERARRARERAQGHLAGKTPGTNHLRAELALKRALSRLRTAGTE